MRSLRSDVSTVLERERVKDEGGGDSRWRLRLPLSLLPLAHPSLRGLLMDLRRDGSASKMALLLCCALVCLLSFRALLTSPHSDAGSLSSASHAQEAWAGGRRELRGGPGSYPPLCTAKCGDCTPCIPVHVAVPPGRPVISEYYPEAWRCKCRNKLYMP